MEFREALLRRRSCRSYQEKSVEPRALGMILEAANAAPVGMKLYENVQLTVVQNQELLSAITENFRKITGKQDLNPLYGAPALILVSVREKEGQIHPVDVANVACIVENMHLQATELNLGSCYLFGIIETLNQSFDLLYKLGLQDGFWPVSALAVGYPTEEAPLREATIKRIHTNFID